jgi:hypothetical protein
MATRSVKKLSVQEEKRMMALDQLARDGFITQPEIGERTRLHRKEILLRCGLPDEEIRPDVTPCV